MRKHLCLLLIFSVLLTLCGCSKTSIPSDAPVTLTFIYSDKNISVTLADDEAATVIDILNGNRYDPSFAGYPSCGFTQNVSLTVGDRVFAIACDTCNCIEDLSKLRFFDIPKEDMDYIHSLFEKYGGYFPCV